MRPRLIALPVALAFAASTAVAVLPATAQASSPDCTYTPVLAKRITVHKAPTVFHTPVAIKGADCTKNFAASVDLKHKGDVYHLGWLYNSRTSSDSIYPVTVKPGTYSTVSSSATCSVTGSDGSAESCAVGQGSTVIKFGGKAHLSAAREKGKDSDKIDLTVHATHYAQYKTAYLTTPVTIQRKDNGTWHNVHTATVHGKHGYVWTHSDPHDETYRATFADTSNTFGATSGTVTK